MFQRIVNPCIPALFNVSELERSAADQLWVICPTDVCERDDWVGQHHIWRAGAAGAGVCEHGPDKQSHYGFVFGDVGANPLYFLHNLSDASYCSFGVGFPYISQIVNTVVDAVLSQTTETLTGATLLGTYFEAMEQASPLLISLADAGQLQ